MTKKADKPLLEQVIRECLAENENALNATMAEEATRRLGRPVDRQEISSFRTEIGLNMYQMCERAAKREVLLALGNRPDWMGDE